jgi:SpoIID/LytB domain protein
LLTPLFALLLSITGGAGQEGGASLLPPPPDAPLTQLYLKRLDFRNGEPTVPVRLMEGVKEAQFTGLGRVRVRLPGPVAKTVEAPAGQPLRVRLLEGRPARLLMKLQLGEFRFADKAGQNEERLRLERLGLHVQLHTLGALYGIAGKVLDNRRQLLLLDEELTPATALERQAQLRERLGVKSQPFETLAEPPHGRMALVDAAGAVLAEAEDLIIAESLDNSGFQVKQVEYGVGYDFHGFEDRTYRGELELAIDRNGRLAVVNLVQLESLLSGLVPSEIFARAHPEALKAQAVTARGEVLAKIGLKHLADPYLLCSEQHCAVYKGRSGEAATTNAAVTDTRGEALFSPQGHLVDSVYSAVCGGHTENNEYVWGGLPDPSLRGKPDLIGEEHPISPENLAAFLSASLPAACRLSTFAQPGKFRWEKRISAAELNNRVSALGVGAVQAISVTERGVSGRAQTLTLSGDRGATQVRGELEIRRLFGMLNSSMFLVEPTRAADGSVQEWVFRGGGWGHGVGMCQTGAVGRAEAGQDYRTILRHYFNGAEVAPIY